MTILYIPRSKALQSTPLICLFEFSRACGESITKIPKTRTHLKARNALSVRYYPENYDNYETNKMYNNRRCRDLNPFSLSLSLSEINTI